MAEQQGGYRQPANPAPVSGPGSLSQRTDGGAIDGMQPTTQAPKYMPGLGYGKGGENMANQQAADLAGNPTPQMAAPAVPLSEPTMRPSEPITAGVDFGPGPGTEAIRVPNMAISPSHTIKLLAQNDPTGEMEMLYQALADKGF